MAYWDTPGKSDEWYTPPHVFQALDCTFDCDVAAPRNGVPWVPASSWISANSLEWDWTPLGFIWMNPPFGGRNGIAPWLDKFFRHSGGIALTPDRTSAPWFQDAWVKADAVLFTRKLRFLRPDGAEGKSPSNGTALLANGERAVAALSKAADNRLGILGRSLRYPAQTREHVQWSVPASADLNLDKSRRSQIVLETGNRFTKPLLFR